MAARRLRTSSAFWLSGSVNGREGDVNVNRGRKGIRCYRRLAKNKRQIGRDKIRMRGYNGLGKVASGHIEISERERVGNCFWIFEVYKGIGLHLKSVVLVVVVQYNCYVVVRVANCGGGGSYGKSNRVVQRYTWAVPFGPYAGCEETWG